MILHVTFSDGSNPWVSLPAERQTIAKQWRRWTKHHPNNANCAAWANGWVCYYDKYTGMYRIIKIRRMTLEKDIPKYKHLGHALAALERIGGM